MKKVDLLLLANDQSGFSWPLGEIFAITPSVNAISECIRQNLSGSIAEAWLFWDIAFGLPDPDLIQALLEKQGDVWHAGLKMGLVGQPALIDFVSPTWMLNRDPDPDIEATSWRMSLRCCLVRTDVLLQMGGPVTSFNTLEGASLEMGHRYIQQGVFIRYTPELLQTTTGIIPPVIPLEDQLRFIKMRYGTKWMRWAIVRAALTGNTSINKLTHASSAMGKISMPQRKQVYHHRLEAPARLTGEEKVSVLIPTINRYPYLRVLLDQLRHQTIKPFEILVIDQTPAQFRDDQLPQQFADLPLRWFTLHQAGQCSSRNFGLEQAQGDFVLFVDDDEEISDNLIECHLASLITHDNSVSNGIVTELNAGPVPANFTFQRISDVFPAGNTLIKKEILKKSRLFDLAYDHGQRADGDLGMRIYLSGERMILNPDISILHHHAPQGGLRTHKARVNTRAASRKKINLRVLPSVSDLYLSHRYFTYFQVREMLWISVLGTFSLHGPWWKKILKALLSLVALPQSIWQIHTRNRTAEKMLLTFPQIPSLENENE